MVGNGHWKRLHCHVLHPRMQVHPAYMTQLASLDWHSKAVRTQRDEVLVLT
jgi:hypothetical protein